MDATGPGICLGCVGWALYNLTSEWGREGRALPSPGRTSDKHSGVGRSQCRPPGQRRPVRCVGRTPAWCREPIRPRMPTNGRSTANRVCRCRHRIPGSPGRPGLTPCDTGRGTGARACSGTGHIATRPRQAQRAPRDGLGRTRTTQISEQLIIYFGGFVPLG